MGLVAGVRGAALALGAGIPLLALRWAGALPAGQALAALAIAVLVVAAMMMWRSPRRPPDVAMEIESRTRAARNLLITAAEIESNRLAVRADVRDVVLDDAASAASRVDLPQLFPLRRPLVWI